MNNSKKRSLHSISQWNVDIGFQHPLCSIRSYHVLPPKDCQYIIDAGEDAAKEQGGWSIDRHDEAPTTDIHFDRLGGKNRTRFQLWKKKLIKKVVSPIIFRDYNASFRSFEDLFLIRYTHNEQPDLKVHRDGTVISCLIQLNDDFQGGGTYIESLDQTLIHNTGDICLHSGWLRHGARAVTKGVRYVLIGFCNIDATWYTHRKLQPNAPYEPDRETLRKAIYPKFRYK
jgi:hypothetical protein